MKRVLFVAYNDLENGGLQGVIMSIVRNLSDKFQFDIISFSKKTSYYDAEFCMYGGKKIVISLYSGTNILRKRLDYYIRAPYLYKSIKRILTENQYDVIHCNNDLESAIFLLAARRVGIPVRIIHSHVSYERFSNLNPIRRKYARILQKVMIENATTLVACSQAAAKPIFEKHNSKIIFNAINQERFNYKKYPCKEHTTLNLLQVGSYSENKNQKFTIQILERLIYGGIEARLFLIGRVIDNASKAYLDNLLKYIEMHNLEKYVYIYPSNANIPEIMQNVDCFILPSHREGLPLALAEAQTMGLCCLVSDSITSESDCGGCTYLSLDMGPEVWAGEIMQKKKAGKLGRCEYDVSKFSIDVVMKEYEALYNGDLV